MATIREKMEMFFTLEEAAEEIDIDPRTFRYQVEVGLRFDEEFIIKPKRKEVATGGKGRPHRLFKGQWLYNWLIAREPETTREELENLGAIIEYRKRKYRKKKHYKGDE